ncbi:S-layer homology domain-containing protein [Bacillus songklensis]|uniref:S-layer homology domain-containing protein n=1 Tax=Bacillus songklensis TaxID=1069116 RepID=A0ABV8B968_9BACI
MKKLLASIGLACAFLFLADPSIGSAHVIDETKAKSAQFDYEDYYQLVASYKSPTGLTIKSYSPKWTTVSQLKAVEAELLKNKHGDEIKLLGQIVIFPDFPAGKGVLGQYFAEYEHSSRSVELLSNRTIHLYGGNQFSTIESIATTLSHEYGHHFTFYHLFKDESLLPEKWMESDYAHARDLSRYPEANTGDGAYEWMMSEILAEDYVQLFGSETALKHHMQFNAQLHTAFEDEDLQTYWMEKLHSSDYQKQHPLGLYLVDEKRSSLGRYYQDLKFYSPNLNNQTTYLLGQDLQGQYFPILIDQLNNQTNLSKWYEASKMDSQTKPLFDGFSLPEVAFQAVQHSDQGFNRGSKKLRLSYDRIEEAKTSYEDIYKQEQPSIAETKAMLYETAIKYNIPPEILKAMAYVETGMKQFDENGQPIISSDGGVGILQVKMSEADMAAKNVDKERLKYDIRYNMETGAALLKEKWNESAKSTPKINDHDPQKLEHWYFAVMAYDGLTKANDPNAAEKGKTYQDQVFEAIRQFSHVPLQAFPQFQVNYHDDGTMEFETLAYNWPGLDTKTTQMHQSGEYVYTMGQGGLYNRVDGTTVKGLLPYTPLQITGGPLEKDGTSTHEVMYKVKGNGMEGYVSSVNLQSGNVKVFPDLSNDNETAAAIAYLQIRGVISGYQDGLFRPNQPLLRQHAAKMLVKELGLTLPQGYQVKATDIKPGDLYYKEMAILEANGLMGKGGAFRPKEPLTRSQMASVLVRAYDKWYKPTEKAFDFQDVPTSHWNYEDINRLANNEITIVKDFFRPDQNVTRSQFALFLKRSVLHKTT